METIILVVLMGVMNLLAFLIGARTGQKVVNNQPIELPKLNPLEVYREVKDKEKAAKDNARMQASLENIDNYTGDSTNQKVIE